MRSIAVHMVCLCVSVGMNMSPAKTAEPIDMPFSVRTHEVSENHGWARIPPGEGAVEQLNSSVKNVQLFGPPYRPYISGIMNSEVSYS